MSDDQTLEREIKLCGDNVKHLSEVSLNNKNYWLSNSNVINLKWKQTSFKKASFKATYTIFTEPNKDGKI